jgi:hypothetical protein
VQISRLQTYRLHLYEDGAQAAVTSFSAVSDLDAARIATAVFQACADVCDSFEVRRNATYVAGMTKSAPRKALSLDELSQRNQEIVAHAEETLLASETRIAASRMLLERTRQFKRVVNGKGGVRS